MGWSSDHEVYTMEFPCGCSAAVDWTVNTKGADRMIFDGQAAAIALDDLCPAHRAQVEQGLDTHLPKIRGGWDGVLLTFGDGCDDGTLNHVLGAILNGYVGRLTLREGMEVEVQLAGLGPKRDDGITTTVQYQLFDNDRGKGVGEVLVVDFDDILAIHIY